LGAAAFKGCTNLTQIVIPAGIAEISKGVFGACKQLLSVYFGGTAEEWALVSIEVDNYYLQTADRYYYSRTAPTQEGDYWYWIDGIPTSYRIIILPDET
jgi:hypothetical protein